MAFEKKRCSREESEHLYGNAPATAFSEGTALFPPPLLSVMGEDGVVLTPTGVRA